MKLFNKDEYVPIIESVIIGLVAGGSAAALAHGVNWLGALRVHLSSILPAAHVLPIFGLLGGLLSGLLVERVAPEASGSGIPQVRARLDRIIMPLDLRIAVAKLIGGTIALGSGLFLGREGPTVQLGAALAAPLARWIPTATAHKRQLIAAGAGAGLTAAFNTPLAGVTFVLEELLKEIKPSTVMIALVACSVACFALNIFSPHRFGQEAGSLALCFNPEDAPFYLLLGLVAGIFGAIFNAAVLGSLKFNQALRMPVYLRVALAGLISGAIISVLPDTFHNYAGMRALIIAGETRWDMVLVAFLEFYLLTLVAYGSGAPGGLFAPSLALGASLGALIGFLDQTLTGTGSTATFALVGMGAFFCAVARTPLTAIVITFELCASFDVLIPLMFSCIISSAVAEQIFKDGLYDHLMRWNGIHLQGPDNLRLVKAKDLMHRNVDTITSKSLVTDVLSLFGSTAQIGFPVVDKGILVGVVTQSDIAALAQGKHLAELRIADVMIPHPVAVNALDPLEEILLLCSRYRFNWLPVVHHDKFKGIIMQSDVLNVLFAAQEQVFDPHEFAKTLLMKNHHKVRSPADLKIELKDSLENVGITAGLKLSQDALDVTSKKVENLENLELKAAITESQDIAIGEDNSVLKEAFNENAESLEVQEEQKSS